MKVMLVDDEPFILEGLSVLIDWEAEGCEIVKKAAGGQEALEYLQQHTVELIITDIKMPEMTGLELIEQIRSAQLSDAYVIILSGYHDFTYAQQAVRYHCMDYLLKPVQRDSLVELIHRIQKDVKQTERDAEHNRQIQEAYLKQALFALLRGEQEEEHISFVRKHLNPGAGEIRYLHICPADVSMAEELSDSELRVVRQQIYDSLLSFFQGENAGYCIKDAAEYEEAYEIGFIYCQHMADNRKMSLNHFLNRMSDHLNHELPFPVILLVGKAVDNMARLSRSYSTACILRSFHGFRAEKSIYYYEEDVQIRKGTAVLCKQSLDRLISAVAQNDTSLINSSIDDLFQEMEQMGMERDLVSMNTNYLLFQLIHLAVEQDETINQEEVMSYISEKAFDSTITRGSRAHLRRFSNEYAEYLIQLRKNVSRGVLLEVEREIRERFAENLTLRELSKKYYVNSSYLGQLFRKKYGQSFKDYLSAYRINEAAQQLLKTDKKISLIAEEAGYRDTDYFISKFIEQKGCTPSKYRKNNGECGFAE
ncbi:MAG: response regulator [Clostridiales bacterium]|nr:response regulator [Clostridiales bacterium]